MEALDQITGRHQYRHAPLDAGDGDRVLLREVIAQAQHQAAEHPGGRHLAQRFAPGTLGTSSPRGPLRDNSQTPSEAGGPKPPPQLGAVAAAG
jgi:hypothetical protein